MNLKPDKQTKVIPKEHQKHRISTLSKTVRLTTISQQDCRKKLYCSFTQLRGTLMTRIIWLRKAYNSKLKTTMHNIFSINRIYSRWASLKGSSYNMETKSMVHWISMKPSSMVRFKKYESLNSTRALTNQLLTVMSGRSLRLKLRNLRRTCFWAVSLSKSLPQIKGRSARLKVDLRIYKKTTRIAQSCSHHPKFSRSIS